MIEITNKNLSGYTFIDLFAGLGGFRLALESLGAECVYTSEKDSAVATVYRKNFSDVEFNNNILDADIKGIPDHSILCAGFPCQPFSISGKRQAFEDAKSGNLIFTVLDIIKEKQPEVVLLENVSNFVFINSGGALSTLKNALNTLGYDFHYEILDACDYNVPQARKRVYIVCFKGGKEFKFPENKKLDKHVEDVIFPDEYKECGSLIKDLYREDISVKYLENVAELESKYSNKPVRVGIVDKGCQGYRVYSLKGTAITLSSMGGGVFSKTGGYHINNKARKLHPRECARLLGFPDTYILDSKAFNAYKQLGNSVVVDVLQYIGQEIGNSLVRRS